MIDATPQRQGIGRAALDLCCDHARAQSHFGQMISSFVPGDDGPQHFCLSYGFQVTGERRNDGTEVEIVLRL